MLGDHPRRLNIDEEGVRAQHDATAPFGQQLTRQGRRRQYPLDAQAFR